MNAIEPSESWGQLGPAMQALGPKHREFVRYLVTGKPGHGALTRAYRLAGYRSGNPSTLSKEAHKLSRDTRIIEAIAEESRKVIRVGHPEAVAALFDIIRDKDHRDRARAIGMILDRVDPAISKHSVDVVHRHEDPDRAALEELKALRQLGTPRQKLLELYGPNGLDRLEALEAAESAQRAAAAKIIDGHAIEIEHEASHG
jgi:hypothetical protein